MKDHIISFLTTHWNLLPPSVRKWLPYAALPVCAAFVVVAKKTHVVPAQLLLWETLVICGYCAAVWDIRDRKVPNKLVLGMLLAWILIIIPQMFYLPEETTYLIFTGFAGFFICGIILLSVYYLSRKGLGGGDVKFMTVAGLYLGIDGVFTAMLYGSILAAVAGAYMVAMKQLRVKDSIPLVPFLYVGILMAILLP